MYEEYFEKLKEECLLRNRTQGTLNQYTIKIQQFMKWMDYKDPNEWTLKDARDFIYDLRVNNHRSTKHCNTVNSALKFFYRFVLHKAWDQDQVPRMMEDLKLPQVIELEKIEAMIEITTEVRNKAIIALLYSSGLRVGELCRLSPKDIYMSTMQIHIKSGKNHCDHWTILSQKSLDYLIAYWKQYPFERDYLFVSLKAPYAPLKQSGIQIMLKKIGDKAGFEHMHPHLLRHSFASHMIEQGVSLEHIQAMMGHRDPASTHKYIHVSNKALMGIKSPLDHPAKKKRGRKKRNEQ